MATIENRPEGIVVVDGARAIPADDRAHAERLVEELGKRAWPRWRVKRFRERVRLDNGAGALRDGEQVVWEGEAANLDAAMVAAAESPLGLDLPALAPFRGRP